jgi:predicted Zn-dependent protease
MQQRIWRSLILAIGLAAIVLFASPVLAKLPPLRSHLLPPSLANWKDAKSSGDYFDQVKRLPVGYLVWSKFPVTVYIQPLGAEEAATPFTTQRAKDWIDAVSKAVQEWNLYLPLKVVEQSAGADITVWRSPPPLRLEPASAERTGAMREGRPTLSLSRARSAETRFEFYAKSMPTQAVGIDNEDTENEDTKAQSQETENNLSLNSQTSNLETQNPSPSAPTLLAQRFTIHLRPDQASSYLQAAARHELGHALGIWGHSLLETDVMYFSQVRNSPPISPRDLNTLKRIYEQPTRVGWRCPSKECG